MRKLIFKSTFALGDIVMLTAAVRDLHRCYPNQFQTDVRTPFPELWENNPYLTPLQETDPSTRLIECSYPLIDRCNEEPYHCLHGYIEFFNSELGLRIRPTAFHGDIHISELEASWYSQIFELTRADIPFWIVVSGGKYDVTVKWWSPARAQAVVDHFDGKIQFVQVGNEGDHHPRLERVIDLRGKTTLRELIRLVHHSQGVLCPITSLMHLAAAIPLKNRHPATRPCVVIAGSREPAHWEAYPGHQFLHTNGALSCAPQGGCWRDRVFPLGDDDIRDQPDHICLNPDGDLPRCMSLITARNVIERIELFFQGGSLEFLARAQVKPAAHAVLATRSNSFDDLPLSFQSVRLACHKFLQTPQPVPPHLVGRGIVICGGGIRHFPGAWVCINILRNLGCHLPIELWHLGPAELDDHMRSLLQPLNVVCVDAFELRSRFPIRHLLGWELKPYALLHSSFREVLLLDADNVPVLDPTALFDSPEYKRAGAVFWPDCGRETRADKVWKALALARPPGPEFESGQILVHKERCWQALSLALWFNNHSDFFYQHLHGDKETFHLAFLKTATPFAMPATPPHPLPNTVCQHDFSGKRLFQHRCGNKWTLSLEGHQFIDDFWFETQCRNFIRHLQQLWNGSIASSRNDGRRETNKASKETSYRETNNV